MSTQFELVRGVERGVETIVTRETSWIGGWPIVAIADWCA